MFRVGPPQLLSVLVGKQVSQAVTNSGQLTSSNQLAFPHNIQYHIIVWSTCFTLNNVSRETIWFVSTLFKRGSLFGISQSFIRPSKMVFCNFAI